MLATGGSKPLQLYEYYICPFCKPVAFLLNSNNIPHDRHNLDIKKGEHKTEEYKKIMPFQRVPCLIDNDFIIFESNTILRYICNSQNVHEHWYPKDPKARALVDLYFDWHATNASNLRKWEFVNVGLSQYTGGMTLEAAKVISDKAFKELEDVFLTRTTFLASNEKITIADLALFWHLSLILKSGYEATERVRSYYNKVLETEVGLKEVIGEFLKNTEESRKK